MNTDEYLKNLSTLHKKPLRIKIEMPIYKKGFFMNSVSLSRLGQIDPVSSTQKAFHSFDVAIFDALKSFSLCTDVYMKLETNFLRQYERVKCAGDILTPADLDEFITDSNHCLWIKNEHYEIFFNSLITCIHQTLMEGRLNFREKMILEEAAYSLYISHGSDSDPLSRPVKLLEALCTSLSEECLSSDATVAFLNFISRRPAITQYDSAKLLVLLTLDIFRAHSVPNDLKITELIKDLLFEKAYMNIVKSHPAIKNLSVMIKTIMGNEELACTSLPFGEPFNKSRFVYSLEKVKAKYFSNDQISSAYYSDLENKLTWKSKCM